MWRFIYECCLALLKLTFSTVRNKTFLKMKMKISLSEISRCYFEFSHQQMKSDWWKILWELGKRSRRGNDHFQWCEWALQEENKCKKMRETHANIQDSLCELLLWWDIGRLLYKIVNSFRHFCYEIFQFDWCRRRTE